MGEAPNTPVRPTHNVRFNEHPPLSLPNSFVGHHIHSVTLEHSTSFLNMRTLAVT